MCGIAGMVRWSGLSAQESGLGVRMVSTLRHRGPDDIGSYEDAYATLGHTRLRIIDPAGGHQPLSNEDGTIHVVFNGEIYNHHALRCELQARGHRLRSRCDTEVLVHLYEELGEDFVDPLNGMFAIALWDARRQRLLLVRDRLGLKPLYWHDDGSRILFGSELKAILTSGDVPDRVDPCAVGDYLTFGHIAAPRTILQGVCQLEPGQLAVCGPSGVRLKRYWDIPAARIDAPPRPAQAYVEEFAALLEDAVHIRMVADVPLGAFLSGGLDSAAVAAAMTRCGRPVLTHTVGFDLAACDEREAARQTASLLGTDHDEVMNPALSATGQGDSLVDLVVQLARHLDEPFADACVLPTYLLCQATQQRVRVALAGDGADELLGGYRRYRFSLAEQRWRGRMPALLQRTCGLLGAVYPQADWLPRPLRARITLQNLARSAIRAHLHSTALDHGVLADRLANPDLRRELAAWCPLAVREELARGYESDHLLGRLLYLDAKTLLPDRMLTKVDRASMAVGLEVREPFLDYRLVALVARLPAEMRMDKRILRETLRRWGLGGLADRRKHGFEVPLDAWFRGPLRTLAHDLLGTGDPRVSAWLDGAAIRRLLATHARGWRNLGPVLWALLMLELWARHRGEYQSARLAAPIRSHRPQQHVLEGSAV